MAGLCLGCSICNRSTMAKALLGHIQNNFCWHRSNLKILWLACHNMHIFYMPLALLPSQWGLRFWLCSWAFTYSPVHQEDHWMYINVELTFISAAILLASCFECEEWGFSFTLHYVWTCLKSFLKPLGFLTFAFFYVAMIVSQLPVSKSSVPRSPIIMFNPL